MEESYENNIEDTYFHYLFCNIMRPHLKYHPDDYRDAMDFFSREEDLIKISGFVLDAIVLDLSSPITCMQALWEKEFMVPVLSKIPFVINLFLDLFCSAGLVIENGIGVSTYRKIFEPIINNRKNEIDELIRTIGGVPSAAREVYKSIRPIILVFDEKLI
ncbi:hypothetical protein B5V00_06825 [Geothermobacter hydrogeniphilus]|uniref:Uncharacterized protein n=2 Tax=Geothermobacter hydrogeniphilus TaxID=1969733 RepID=A0A1X0Y812_9BACT|nr:hypothetical protein B5V00_06825 [Geothermobacter hydrogeniphilus]